jgi:hypothetical protein
VQTFALFFDHESRQGITVRLRGNEMLLLNKQLPITLYDGVWIDCIHNNLLAILSTQNPSYGNMNLNLRRNYSICRFREEESLTEELVSKAIYPGYFVLEVRLEYPKFGDAVAFEQVDTYSMQNIHEVIRAGINEGKYVFIKLDRYFIPHSKNYRKNHFANVAVVYGYDDSQNEYLVINDFRISRTYEFFKLSYDMVNQAYHESTDFDRVFFLVSITEAAKQTEIKVSKDKIIDNLTCLLDTRVQEEDGCGLPGIERQFGLTSVLEYAEHFTDYFPLVMVDYLPAIYNAPLDFQRLNMLVLQALEEEKVISALQGVKLKQIYGELLKLWEIYRNKIYLYVGRKQMNAPTAGMNDFVSIQKLLFTIFHKEKEAAERFLETLHR